MSDTNKKLIEELLRMLAVGQQLDTQQQKQMEDYKFWKTQPVPRLDAEVELEGPIQTKKVEDIPATPLPLLADFEWVNLDVDLDAGIDELYDLLYHHYVEDADATFRFNYLAAFFQWALKPPGWRKDWHVGVRVKLLGKLVAFILGVPVLLQVRTKDIKAVEINFLCIHKQLRSKRLAPILIKEITRRVNRCDIWQALYTVGLVLPLPVSTCRYTHRPLNWLKLHDVGFSHLPSGTTKAQMTAKFAVSNNTKTEGLRRAVVADVPQMLDLFSRYQATRFDLVQTFTQEEFAHWLIGSVEGRTELLVVHTYVVESADGRITDFFSFYLLPFTVLESKAHDQLGVAYLYYYASEEGCVAKDTPVLELGAWKKRLQLLVLDALVLTKQQGVDVFNALTSQDNNLFIKDLMFGAGDGFLNFYLFNYKAFPVHGGLSKTKEVDQEHLSGVGAVML